MENTKWLLIENKGEIDINALILMGGSTKRDSSSAIGFFGSGNKYSIALMLKKEIPFRIFSGEKELVISTKDVQFRDKEFKQILINGQETSLTTDMGPQWDSWMGIREWVSNSIDETESNIINATEDINPKEGYTRIYVQHHPDIKAVIDNWNRYFSFDRIDSVLEVGESRMYPNTDLEKQSLLMYRKGIQCYHLPTKKALYTYDLPVFKINESRVLSDTWDARKDICKFLAKSATVEIATNILGNSINESYYEGGLDWDTWEVLQANWRTAIGARIIVNNDASGFYMKELGENPHYRVSRALARAIKNAFSDVKVYGVGQDSRDDLNWREVESTPKIQYMLKKALEFCKDTDYSIDYDIKIVEFDKIETLGLAHDNTIYIAAKAFDMGMKDTVMTIMEENEHLKTNLKDETRGLEQHLFRSWLSEKELRYGIFL